MSDQFPQEDRYCINCKHHSQLGGFVMVDPRVEQHVCRHENNIVIDINPVTGDKKYRFETCVHARYEFTGCDLKGKWYEERLELTIDGLIDGDGAITKQKSPSKEKFVIGDNL